ncbi:hypothetical protein KR52_03040 [Synechococcus sp. KORDI-52]|nr:hypothetical protein KR52_03040 [Synechococcus sp. KORDI-52]
MQQQQIKMRSEKLHPALLTENQPRQLMRSAATIKASLILKIKRLNTFKNALRPSIGFLAAYNLNCVALDK